MSTIHSNHSVQATMDKLEKTIIPYSLTNPGQFGYVGRVDAMARQFWLVNHTQVIMRNRGSSFRSFRRLKEPSMPTGERPGFKGILSSGPSLRGHWGFIFSSPSLLI